MLCGPPNIWPQPTVKTVLGNKSLKFRSSDIKFSVQSPNTNVNILLKNAFEIFQKETQELETSTGNIDPDVDRGSSSGNSNGRKANCNDNNNNNNNANLNSNSINLVTMNNEISDNFLPFLSTGKNYDVARIQINAKVLNHADTYLTLHTDESYNLTLNCKYHRRFFYFNDSFST